MTVVADIFASWGNPRGVIARKLAQGPREDRALATLFGGCGLLFVAQLPGLARAAYIDPTVPFEARLGATLLGLMFVLPLVFYLVAAIIHLISRAFGGKGSGFAVRRALFWALLAASPALLLNGLATGFLQPGALQTALGLLTLACLVYLVISMVFEAESGHDID